MKQNDRIFLLGMTGGVGAGKSAVLSVLKEKYGAYLILSDEVGHRLRRPGMPVYNWMVEEYGREILLPDETVNPAAVAARAFSDAERTKRLNDHTHPLIRQAILEEISRYGQTVREGTVGLAVLESALMTEGRLKELCDELWYVYVPSSLRIDRLMKSRGYSRQRCGEIISRQKSDEDFRREVDAVIDNSGLPEETERQIECRMEGIFSRVPNLH